MEPAPDLSNCHTLHPDTAPLPFTASACAAPSCAECLLALARDASLLPTLRHSAVSRLRPLQRSGMPATFAARLFDALPSRCPGLSDLLVSVLRAPPHAGLEHALPALIGGPDVALLSAILRGAPDAVLCAFRGAVPDAARLLRATLRARGTSWPDVATVYDSACPLLRAAPADLLPERCADDASYVSIARALLSVSRSIAQAVLQRLIPALRRGLLGAAGGRELLLDLLRDEDDEAVVRPLRDGAVFEYAVEAARRDSAALPVLDVLARRMARTLSSDEDDMAMADRFVFTFPVLVAARPVTVADKRALQRLVALCFQRAPVQVLDAAGVSAVAAGVVKLCVAHGNASDSSDSERDASFELLANYMCGFDELLVRYRPCATVLYALLQVCVAGTSLSPRVLQCTQLLTSCVERFCALAVSGDANIDDDCDGEVKKLGKYIFSNCVLQQRNTLHGKLHTVDACLKAHRGETRAVTDTFDLFRAVLSAGRALAAPSDQAAVRRWCWHHLPVHLVFGLKAKKGENGEKEEDTEKTDSVFKRYVFALAARGEGARATEVDRDVPLEETAFLAQLGGEGVLNSVPFQLLYAGVLYGGVHVLSRPDKIVRQLLCSLNRIVEGTQRTGNPTKRQRVLEPMTDTDVGEADGETEGDVDDDYTIVQIVQVMYSICKLHHMLFPLERMNAGVAPAFAAAVGEQERLNDVTFDVLLQLARVQTLPDGDAVWGPVLAAIGEDHGGGGRAVAAEDAVMVHSGAAATFLAGALRSDDPYAYVRFARAARELDALVAALDAAGLGRLAAEAAVSASDIMRHRKGGEQREEKDEEEGEAQRAAVLLELLLLSPRHARRARVSGTLAAASFLAPDACGGGELHATALRFLLVAPAASSAGVAAHCAELLVRGTVCETVRATACCVLLTGQWDGACAVGERLCGGRRWARVLAGARTQVFANNVLRLLSATAHAAWEAGWEAFVTRGVIREALRLMMDTGARDAAFAFFHALLCRDPDGCAARPAAMRALSATVRGTGGKAELAVMLRLLDTAALDERLAELHDGLLAEWRSADKMDGNDEGHDDDEAHDKLQAVGVALMAVRARIAKVGVSCDKHPECVDEFQLIRIAEMADKVHLDAPARTKLYMYGMLVLAGD